MKPLAYSYLRFSTPEQALGISEERQMKEAIKWAKAKGVRLVNEYADRGTSGFRGRNRKKGALGRFLKCLEAGEIRKGSYLLVEDVDRLSREHPLDSMFLVRRIIAAGAVLVVVKSKEEFSEESIRNDRSGLKLMGLVFQLGRSSGESARKSDLGGENWEKKRLQAAEGKVVTGLTPAWIQTSGEKDARRFALIPKRAEIVKQIYRWSIAGLGARSIAARLNASKEPNWGRGKRVASCWHASYILKILNSRAVLGEFQPHHYISIPDPADSSERVEIRVPVGTPLKHYYPRLLDDETFERARLSRAKAIPGGCTKERVSNLFPGLLFAQIPDPSLSLKDPSEPGPPPTTLVPCFYKSKGTNHGHGTYIVAEVAPFNMRRKRADELPSERWPYRAVEYAVLETLREINWGRLAAASEAVGPNPADHLRVLEHAAADLKRKCDNLADAIAKKPLPALLEKLERMEESREQAAARALDAQRLLQSEAATHQNLMEPLPIRKRAYDPTALDVRLALRGEIAKRIKSIHLSPKRLIERKNRPGRVGRVHAFEVLVFFVGGATRFIRITLNKGKPPTVQNITFNAPPSNVKARKLIRKGSCKAGISARSGPPAQPLDELTGHADIE